MVAAAERGGGRARVLETRKTAPGLRAVDKWAVAIGGGENHRYGLYDMMLVKDNHIAAAGGVAAALGAAVDWIEARGSALEVEVETRTLDEVRIAVHENVAIIFEHLDPALVSAYALP